MKKIIIFLLIFLVLNILIVKPVEALYEPLYSGSLIHSTTFTPGSTAWWESFGLSEIDVFHSRLKHTESNSNTWEIRIGKGSQIYSIRTAVGEIIGAQLPRGAFIDRVLQQVLVDQSKHTPSTKYFIHQAGNYALDGLTKPWFSPMFSTKFDNITHSLQTISWSQQAHIPTAFQSSVILEQKIKDLGDGIIEITYITNNYGNDTFDFSNQPWVGIKKSSVPKIILSQQDGSIIDVQGTWSGNVYPIATTNGWVAFVTDNTPQSLGLGIVFGKDTHLTELNHRASAIRVGYKLNEDLSVLERTYKGNINPNQSYFFRYYLIINTLENIKKYGNLLASSTDYGPITNQEQTTLLRPLCKQGTTFIDCPIGTIPDIVTYQKYIPGAYPLFILREKSTGNIHISDDPYLLSSKPYDQTVSRWIHLGWVLPQSKTSLTPTGTCSLYEPLSNKIPISDLKDKTLVGRTNFNINCLPLYTTPSYNIADIAPDSGPDGKVDIFDFNSLVFHFGQTGAVGWIRADIIKNGVVDIFDFNKLVENFGK